MSRGCRSFDRAAGITSHRLKQHLNRSLVPEWVPVPFKLYQQVYLNPCPKGLVLRNRK